MKNALRSLLILTISGWLACFNNDTSAQSWTQTDAPSGNWHSIASSADGSKMVAAAYGGGSGGVYTSTNSGATWTLTDLPSGGLAAWRSVKSSADGNKLVASSIYSKPIYVSTNGGLDWATNGPVGDWEAVACSADGNKIVAASSFDDGPLIVSTNFGISWTEATLIPNFDNHRWRSVAASSDGSKMVAVASGLYGYGPIYTSSDSGATWFLSSAPYKDWISVASSSDGSKLFAVCDSIYMSADSGTTWTLNSFPSQPWSSIASSADGTKLLAVAYNYVEVNGFTYTFGGIFRSTNSGNSWVTSIGPSNYWFAANSSADGCRMAVAVQGGGIYNSQDITSPEINITSIEQSIILSWIISSTNYVAQTSSDLVVWSDLTNNPVLNFINLLDEIILPNTGNETFFRLKSP